MNDRTAASQAPRVPAARASRLALALLALVGATAATGALGLRVRGDKALARARASLADASPAASATSVALRGVLDAREAAGSRVPGSDTAADGLRVLDAVAETPRPTTAAHALAGAEGAIDVRAAAQRSREAAVRETRLGAGAGPGARAFAIVTALFALFLVAAARLFARGSGSRPLAR